MAKVVRAKQDFDVDKRDDRITVTYHSVNRLRFTLMTMALFVLFFAAAISGVMALISGLDSGRDAEEVFQVTITVFVISIVASWLAYRWGNKKLPRRIVVDRDGVTKDNKTYIFGDIDDIGWQFGNEGTTLITSQAQAAGMDMQRTISGIVYLTYGNKKVTLLSGLGERETERAFEVLRGAMNDMGASFGETKTTA
ncbi:hypothetical protein ACN2XU_13155 [Primorskyibacter sp. 2E107]|uniref:hypothetical protein n=1 Tax=Primorskyibacter sp. 2E107 TaxID=3403458 RepID=UPI003AF69A7D